MAVQFRFVGERPGFVVEPDSNVGEIEVHAGLIGTVEKQCFPGSFPAFFTVTIESSSALCARILPMPVSQVASAKGEITTSVDRVRAVATTAGSSLGSVHVLSPTESGIRIKTA
jgi:hypothetical protein